MNLSKMRFVPLALGASILAACSGIGEGSTVTGIEILHSPALPSDPSVIDDSSGSKVLEMYDCFCSNIASIGTFTNGVQSNFSYRTKWTSSNEAVAKVLNFGETDDVCPFLQRAPGMVRPVGPGTATLTGEFLGFTSTITVHVVDTATAANNTFTFAASDTTNTENAVPVGGVLPMSLKGTLGSIPRTFFNVAKFALSPENDAVAIMDANSGFVRGLSQDLNTDLNGVASFGSCSFTVPATIHVGEVVSSQITVTEEAGFTQNKLALSNNEILKVKAPLDRGNGAALTVPVDISSQARAAFTDSCTKRHYPGTGTTCTETVEPDCASDLPVCLGATATFCSSSTDDCRVAASPFTSLLQTRIVAASASPLDGSNNPMPTTFFARYPATRGVNTTLTTALGASTGGTADSVTVASLVGYPTFYPWEAVIGSEIVQVTAADNLTLSIVRGYRGTTASAHAAGDAFSQRQFSSKDNGTGGTVQVAAVDGVLKDFTIDPPGTLSLYGTVQLQATGNYVVSATDSTPVITQPVTHATTFASGSPTMAWASSHPSIAVVSSSGLVTATNPCGGTVVIRARATTSTNTADQSFVRPSATPSAVDTSPQNANDDTNDAACLADDPLCDQVTFLIPRQSPLPAGYTADACDDLQ